MSLIGTWLELPVWQLLGVLGAFYALTGAALHLLAFHGPASGWVRSFRGLVPPFFAAAVVIFALLLGFVAGEVWHRNAEAAQVVRSEADTLLALKYLVAEKDPVGAKPLELIRDYAQAVIKDEWPRMEQGRRTPAAEAAYARLLSAIVEAPVSGANAAAVERARLDTMLKLHTVRGARLALAADRTDELKWATLLVLGLLAQLSIAAVHLEMPRPQIAALTIFSIAAVIALGLVALQERPFSPPIEVVPGPLEEVVQAIPVR